MAKHIQSITFIALIAMPIAGVACVETPASQVDDAGTLYLPGDVSIPYSDLASPEARENFIDTVRGYEAVLAKPEDWRPKEGETDAEAERRWYDETLYIPWLTNLRQHFDVNVEPRLIAGVQTDVVTPKEGIAEANMNRVLINLHGGGMIVGGRYGGQLESIPVSSIGGFKVITVDYRMAPEYHYPAAEEDVVAVYRELLKTYPPDNIGIYGCSAGGFLTGTSIASLIASGEPKPGAIGMFGGGPFGRGAYGDSNYIFSGGEPFIPPDTWDATGSYMDGAEVDDPEVYPAESIDIQSRFPPTLLMSGTRDLALSKTLFAHALLVNRGVDAELHVWEGAPHCSFAQPFVDPDVPESQQAWMVMTEFFDRHLGR